MKLRANMPFRHYLDIPATSISGLKELRRSPLHYLHRKQNPKAPSPAMVFGTAAHCAVLEPERFERDYVVWDRRTDSGASAPRRGKEWEKFCAELPDGAEIITVSEAAACRALQAAVRGDPVAAPYLASGMPEVVAQWELDGHACKGRFDWLTEIDGQSVLVGLKTTRDVAPRPFAATAARLGYHLQWAWYADGYELVTGRENPRVVEIVVEADAPHAVVVYDVAPDVLEQGRTEYARLLELYRECKAADSWPGPATTLQVFSLPAWAYDAETDAGAPTLDWEDAA